MDIDCTKGVTEKLINSFVIGEIDLKTLEERLSEHLGVKIVFAEHVEPYIKHIPLLPIGNDPLELLPKPLKDLNPKPIMLEVNFHDLTLGITDDFKNKDPKKKVPFYEGVLKKRKKRNP